MIDPFLKLALVLIVLISACGDSVVPSDVPKLPPLVTATATQIVQTATPSATPEDPLAFAVIGDYGQAGKHASDVATMIDSWSVDFIITTGDNNYPVGAAQTIDENIGRYYQSYIGSYKGEYHLGSPQNMFFPSLGNHDWSLGNIDPYLDYFTLPGNERYYDVVIPPIHLFIIDSDTHEPDGVGVSSVQATWLRESLENSTERWQIVAMHHPPYSSGDHGSTDYMQWPFDEWGVEAVLAGHDHLYERLEVEGVVYLITGLGGHEARYDFVDILPESQFRYNDDWGALRATATDAWIRFEFINVSGEVVDSFVLESDLIYEPG